MKGRFWTAIGVTAPLTMLFSACATMSVDAGRMRAIHRVAIVGFSVEQQQPPGMLFGGGGRETTSFSSSLGQASAQGDRIYESLRKSLRHAVKWSVLDREKLARIPAYAALHETKMKGIQNRPPLGADKEAVAANGVIDAFPMERLTAEERRDLMKKLGVDAIAIATVRIDLEQGGGLMRLVGSGTYKPRATARFVVYDGGEEPVWRDLSATGASLDEGAKHVLGATSKTEVERLALLAAERSYATLSGRLKEQNAEL